MREQKGIFYNIDKVLLLIFVLLVACGWINIYAAVYSDEHRSIFDLSQRYGKQLIWIGSAFIIAMAILIIDIKFIVSFSYVFYGISILFLLFVLAAGSAVSGSKSWFHAGGFALQPGEFAKFATCLALAKYLSSQNVKLNDRRTVLTVIFLLLLPVLLILKQNDLGSAMVFVAFVFMFYREGFSGNILIICVLIFFLIFMALVINKFILLGLLAVIVGILFFFIKRTRKNIFSLIGLLLLASVIILSVDYGFEHILEKHQKTRINVLLGKEIDPKGAGYNINQSKIAIGSGGFWGKGFLKGTQTKYNFVPEQSTDFIFCTVGEEWGFIGSLYVVGMFVALLFRLIFLAERQRSAFSRIYGYGVVSIFFIHFFINIGMATGLVPVIGIPLPFFSYGGSSLWGFTVLLFIFLRLDASRTEYLV